MWRILPSLQGRIGKSHFQKKDPPMILIHAVHRAIGAEIVASAVSDTVLVSQSVENAGLISSWLWKKSFEILATSGDASFLLSRHHRRGNLKLCSATRYGVDVFLVST